MSVSEKESGIVDTHVRGIEQTAASENTFIFIRPTEYDSTVLIRAGYATKSMDVHHKSSNWGPMAGFVPCDPAFSKKLIGAPNPHEHEHKHGAAHPVQLALKDSLLKVHEKIEFKSDFILVRDPSAAQGDIPFTAKRVTGDGMAATRARFEAMQSGRVPDHKFCVAKPAGFGNLATLFCLINKAGQWLVYWVKWDGDVGRLHPLRVFAYPQRGRLNPVTGDYDLWMVAPHVKHLDKHLVTRLERDVHGASAASGYTMNLLQKMNASCSRSDNPVFNHGAESQNYGFTQSLDMYLAMFTSAGTSRMVRMDQMPGILADLHQAGYMVVWNKRYGEVDPRLSGSADKRGEIALGKIKSKLDDLFKELEEIRRAAEPKKVAAQAIASHRSGAAKMPDAMQSELFKMASRFETSRNLGHEQSRIYRFNRSLLRFLESQSGRFRVLNDADFPVDYRVYNQEAARLHLQLQQAMVRATTGSGETDEKLLNDWLAAHKHEIETIKDYWS